MTLYSIIRKLKFIYTPLFPLFFFCIWPIPLGHNFFFRGRAKRKRILLIAQNNVAADHIKDIHEILQNHSDISLYVTTDWYPPRNFNKNDISRIIKTKYIHIFHALLTHWDLIIFVNHPWGFGVWFAPFIKKIYINHGLHTGKINNTLGEDGVYGISKVIRPFKQPFYQYMFVSSVHEQQQAIAVNPLLHDRLHVAGFLKADNLISNNIKREHFRRQLNFSRKDYVIHIISTWGPHSLMQTIGGELLEQAIHLSSNSSFKFIISLHPRHDEFGDIKARSRDEILDYCENSGLNVNWNMDWDKHIISADCAISDHSSLGLYYFLLNKPLALINIDETEYVQNYLFNYIKNHFPILHRGQELESIINTLKSKDFSIQIEGVKKMIIDYPGEASARYIRKIKEILDQP
jgi:CDP-glycerol:poly(glycerophosphate) glycerophosphotransferase